MKINFLLLFFIVFLSSSTFAQIIGYNPNTEKLVQLIDTKTDSHKTSIISADDFQEIIWTMYEDSPVKHEDLASLSEAFFQCLLNNQIFGVSFGHGFDLSLTSELLYNELAFLLNFRLIKGKLPSDVIGVPPPGFPPKL